MIELDLETFRDPLKGFLTIGPKWLFTPGYVFTSTKEKQVFARMAMQGLTIGEKDVNPLFDMTELAIILKEPKVKKVHISVESGHLMVSEPIVMQVAIPRDASLEEGKRLVQFDEMCQSIETEAENDKASSFVAERETFLTLLNLVGSPDMPIRISTGESIKVQSYKGTGETVYKTATYAKISADIPASVKLSKRAQGHLRRTLEGTSEKGVRVIIPPSRPYCIFQNNELTVLAGGMMPKK